MDISRTTKKQMQNYMDSKRLKQARQCCTRDFKRTGSQEETSAMPGMQQWNKGMRLKGAAVSRK
jgi:hypothetical protein